MRVKTVVYIPYSDLPKETILQRLAIQNRGLCLNTSIWTYVRMKEEKFGQTMVAVFVDEESAEFLQCKNHMVGLNFTPTSLVSSSRSQVKEKSKILINRNSDENNSGNTPDGNRDRHSSSRHVRNVAVIAEREMTDDLR